MMRYLLKLFELKVLLLALGAVDLLAAEVSVTLEPKLDTSIIASGVNPRGDETILSGTRNTGVQDRGLLRFDLSSIPSGANISSVVLRLRVVMVPGTATPSDFGLYRMLKDWDASATWLSAKAGSLWSAAGGAAGTDFALTNSVVQAIAGQNDYEFGPSAGLLGDVRFWVANPGSNNGWLLKSEDEASLGTARHFGATEQTDLLARPELIVTYSLATSNGPELHDPQFTSDHFSFTFNSGAGQAYRVEAASNLGQAGWTTVTNIPSVQSPGAIPITVPGDAPQRFFRVAVE